MIKRRGFIKASIGLTLGSLGYLKLFEPFHLKVRERSTTTGKKLSHPIRVMHISDLHYSDCVPINYLRATFTKALKAKPDLIVVTGDFYTDDPPDANRLATELRRLSDEVPVLACPGNHDGGAWALKYAHRDNLPLLREICIKANVDLLENQHREIQLRGTKICVTGVGDLWAGHCPPDQVIAQTPTNDLNVLLCHNPDAKNQVQHLPWDIMLSGHTHGGQAVFPFIGAPWAPIRDTKFLAGLHEWDNRLIHVSRGVGNLHGIRFNCPPDITLLELT